MTGVSCYLNFFASKEIIHVLLYYLYIPMILNIFLFIFIYSHDTPFNYTRIFAILLHQHFREI